MIVEPFESIFDRITTHAWYQIRYEQQLKVEMTRQIMVS